MNNGSETCHCPCCGHDVTRQPETEYGVFCENCGGDFWKSETISGSEIHRYEYRRDYNLMVLKK